MKILSLKILIVLLPSCVCLPQQQNINKSSNDFRVVIKPSLYSFQKHEILIDDIDKKFVADVVSNLRFKYSIIDIFSIGSSISPSQEIILLDVDNTHYYVLKDSDEVLGYCSLPVEKRARFKYIIKKYTHVEK